MAQARGLSSRTFTAVAILQTGFVLAALLVLGWRVHSGVREVYMESLADRLHDAMVMLSRQPSPKNATHWCSQNADNTQIRITLVNASDDHILCDSATDFSKLPLVATGPEIRAAVASPDRLARSRRVSRGLGYEEGVFEAQYFPDRGQILRLGLTSAALHEQLATMQRMFILAVSFLSVALTALLYWTTRRILFQRASRAVETSEQLLQENLVANVSHEFRTPLTSIRGFADAIDQDIRSGRPPNQKFASIIKKESDRLLTLVSDLLDLAMIDSRRLDLTLEEVQLAEITQDALQTLKMAYGQKNQQVSVTTDTAHLRADSARLHQVLLNLVGNAMKYSPAGAQIGIHWSRSGDGVTELRVSDNGPGIASQDLPLLFQRFTRGKPQATHDAPGTGLGLAIVRGLVEAHGGTVGIASEPGKGATFWARFPQS